MTEAGFVTKMLLLAAKDLRVQARGRETFVPMAVFAAVVGVVLAFSLPSASTMTPTARADVVSGFLWITVLFSGLVGFARTFEVERDEGAIDVLLLLPLDRSGLFAAKSLANLASIAALELFTLPLFALLFGLDLGTRWATLVGVVALVDVGFVATGTLLASLAAQTRSRELLLPILALPALVPVFVAAVELTSDLFVGAPLGEVSARGWFAVLVAFDVVASVVGALTFEFVIE